jgi:hypothetical protein
VIYSYLEMHELIMVASLSKRERETVLNSKIVKQNRNEEGFRCKFDGYNFTKTVISITGLLIAIKLSNIFVLYIRRLKHH